MKLGDETDLVDHALESAVGPCGCLPEREPTGATRLVARLKCRGFSGDQQKAAVQMQMRRPAIALRELVDIKVERTLEKWTGP